MIRIEKAYRMIAPTLSITLRYHTCAFLWQCTQRRSRRAWMSGAKPGEDRRQAAGGELALIRRLDGWIRRRTPKIFRSSYFRFPYRRREQAPALRNPMPFPSCPPASGAHSRQMNANLVRRPGSRGGTPLVQGAGAQSPRSAFRGRSRPTCPSPLRVYRFFTMSSSRGV